jgi:hypothetical protein
MSSDVYFYISEAEDPHNYVERVSVGHLGVLCYFGFDALGKLENCIGYNQQITNELIARMKIIIRHAHSSILIDKQLSEWEFANCYGYCGPTGVDWDYIITEVEIENSLKEYIGRYIKIMWV